MRVFENRGLRNIFGPKKDKNTGWRKSTMRSFITFTLLQILLE
jgi:hypothetical protein